MKFFISDALETTESNSVTSITVWLMIVFLILLIGGLLIALIKQLREKKQKQKIISSTKKAKGF